MGIEEISETRSTRRSTRSSTKVTSPPVVTTPKRQAATTPSSGRGRGRKKKVEEEEVEQVADEVVNDEIVEAEKVSPKVTPPPRKRQRLADTIEEIANEELKANDEPDSSEIVKETNGDVDKMEVDEEEIVAEKSSEASAAVPSEIVEETKTVEEETKVEEVAPEPSTSEPPQIIIEEPVKEVEKQVETTSEVQVEEVIEKPQEVEVIPKQPEIVIEESPVEAMEVDSSNAIAKSIESTSTKQVEEIQKDSEKPSQVEDVSESINNEVETSAPIEESPVEIVEESKEPEITSSTNDKSSEVNEVVESEPTETVAQSEEVVQVVESANPTPEVEVSESTPEVSESVSSEVVNDVEKVDGEPTQVFEISSDNQAQASDQQQTPSKVIDTPQVESKVEEVVESSEATESSAVIEKQVEVPSEGEKDESCVSRFEHWKVMKIPKISLLLLYNFNCRWTNFGYNRNTNSSINIFSAKKIIQNKQTRSYQE